MTDQAGSSSGTSAAVDRVERLVNEQLRIMEKQLDLMRSLEVAHDAAPSDRRLPITDAQRDVWIMCQLSAEGSAAYDLSNTLSLKGDLNVEALHESLKRVVERHGSLRTTFDATGDHQIVHRTLDVELPVIDLSDGADPDRARKLAAILESELTIAYDLVEGPLFRFTLIRLGESEHTLALSAHHLVCDGWSFGVMQRDLGAIYSSLVGGRLTSFDDATQFAEYAAWQAEQSTGSEPFWLQLYRDPPVQLDLSTDKARPPVRSFEYGTERVAIGEDLLTSLRDFAVAQGVSLFVVLLAAWEILLHRLSGQSEFASGVYVAGQASMGARDLVGLCANFLPLRVHVTPEESLSDYLRRSTQRAFDAFDHQHYAVGKLASALGLPRDASRPTLVSTVITLETPTSGIHFEGLKSVDTSSGRQFGAFDFEAYLTESEADLMVDFQYSRSLFDSVTIRRWVGYYIHLLQQMTSAADRPVSDLRLLDHAESREVLLTWNDTDAPVPDRTTHELFERQAARHSDDVAIRTSSAAMTYGELNARANQLARHLRGLGVEPGRLVGVHVERSPDMLVALLAVHKAGGAYVPLDPLFPEERLTMIAADAGLHVLLTQEALVGAVVAEGAVDVALDRDAELIAGHDASDLGFTVRPTDLAYVIYTSGSTGRPKGVEVEHLGLTNLLESMRHRPGLDADDVMLAVTTMSFDIAALELFLPLIVGATVVVAVDEEAVDALWLRERLAAGDITVMQATPATWQLLLDVGWTGTAGLKALCGGEALSQELAATLGARVASLWNMYGPTETTIWSSVSEVGQYGRPVSIGQPIANTELHVLDPTLQLQPLGVPGELYIGGMGLARGYRNQPDLTVERFITSQIDGEPARRLYRTGDVVRRLRDGQIEYLGRTDFQVKIRGFRIELGEIETVLGRHPDIKECAVVARDGGGGSKRLVAYVVPAHERPGGVSTLRAYLHETLPDYMVPALFVVIDAFPLTANRKVDRARLPDPDGQRPDLATELVGPRTENETRLARIWEELLGVQLVGVEDNFFDLGGDSLLALRSIVRANGVGMNLAPISIFRHQTIAELAQAAEAVGQSGSADQEVVTGPTPLTPAQLRFLNERHTPDPHQWNVSTLVYAERLSKSALKSAVEALVWHHDALRLRLWQEDGRWRQEIAAPSGEIPFESHDLSGLSTPARRAAIERICSRLQESFELAQGPLLRVAHFDCGSDQPDRLFVTIHHFAVDGLTFPVFWEDLEQAYQQAAEGNNVSLPPKTTPFRAWAMQLEDLVQTQRVVGTVEEWVRLPWNEVARLPADFETRPGDNTNDSTAALALELSAQDTQRLLDSRFQPAHVIITALARCLSSWTSSRTVLVDVLSHGRDAVLDGVNLSRTVGFTLSYNPLVLSHPTWHGTSQTLGSIVDQIDRGPEGFTFELLRFLARDQGLRDRLSELPRAELLFNYAGSEAGLGDDALWRPATEPTGDEESPRGTRQYPVAVRATLTPNLLLTFVYSTRLHTAATIEAKVAEVAASIRGLLGA